MKATVESLPDNKVKLNVELEQEEIDKAIDEAFKKISRQVNIPGFRPGKAPRRLVEARVGLDAARAQALNDSIPEYYMQALGENEVDPIGQPENLQIVSGEEEGPVIFEAEVPVRPVPLIGGYKGLRVTVPNPVPTDSELADQIDRLRIQNSELQSVDRESKPGDFVILDIKGTHDGEPVAGLTVTDYSYEVGQSFQSLGPDFDGQVTGVTKGAELRFTSNIPPNDQEVDFEVTVKGVEERLLPEVTDEWASEVSEFETVDELRNDISTRLSKARQAEAERALHNGAVEAIADLVENEVEELPQVLVDNEMQRQLRDLSFRLEQQGANLAQFLAMTGQDQDEFVEQLRSAATRSVHADLGLRSLAEKEGLQVTAEDIDKEVEALARQFNQKVAKVRRDLEHADQIPAVRSDIRKSKAVEWLMDNVEIVDSDGNAIDREALRFDPHEGHDHDHDHAGSEA